jgi:predicted RNA-binding protein with PUA-like domain
MLNRSTVARASVVLAGVVAILSGCSKKEPSVPAAATDQGKSATERSSILQPAPANKESADSRLMRFDGQTKFLNFHQEPMWARNMAMASPAAAKAEGAQQSGTVRAIQESDVFKIGKPGDKVVFLLNNYRGLQIVSYQKGIDKPEILGRVPATGNYSDDMYYAKDDNRIYVLERYYYDPNDDYYSARNSRVLVYNVENLSKPALIKSVELTGEIADSTFATDEKTKESVLYVALSQWGSFWWQGGGTQKATGMITAYKVKDLEKDAPAPVDSLALSLPVSQRENMNIVTVPLGDGTNNYYLVAVLSESGWGWWDRKNTIELVDITSSAGDIKPVMTVNAKGFIAEKSQTFIKNNALTVVSNYTPDVPNAKARIAVETFKFPTEGTKGISESVAAERALHIQNELAKISDINAKEEAYKKLVEDPKMGLKGVFVSVAVQNAQNLGLTAAQAGTRLLKKVADFQQTQGDTRGLDAQLKDVRLSPDSTRLYAFWVPVNKIDPLDVYDYSNPEKGIAHIGHTEDMEGWVDRAFPVTFKGNDYLVGLGWKVIGENNETNKSVPQAVVFKVTKQNNPKKPILLNNLEQVDLSNKGNVWVNFNQPDKFVDYKFDTAKGTGTILFQIDSWGADTNGSGGKLLGFDLNAADSGNGSIFTPGATLVAGSGNYEWLRRVFNNPELEIINTFSDKTLGTFKVDGIGKSEEIAKAINTLELARNIRAYVTLNKAGVQIVDDGSGYWWGNDKGKTTLRLVERDKADTEATNIKSTKEIEGPYASHLVLKDGTLLVLTSSRKSKTTGEGEKQTVEYFDSYTLTPVKAGDDLQVKTPARWETPATFRPGPIFFAARSRVSPWGWGSSSSVELVQTKAGQVLALAGAEARLVTVTDGNVTTQVINTKACSPDKIPTQITVLDDGLFAGYSKIEDDKSKPNVKYEANYIATAELKGTTLSCSAPVNIPGTLLAVVDGDKLITTDNRLEDLNPFVNPSDKKTYYNPVIKPVLASLKLTTAGGAATATLKDLYDPTGVSSQEMHKIGNGFVFLDIDKSNSNARYQQPTFAKLTLNATSLRFEKDTKVISLKKDGRAPNNLTLAAIFTDEKKGKGTYLGVVLAGRLAFVVEWSDKDLRPVQKDLELVDPDFTKAKRSEAVVVMNPWSLTSGRSSDQIHFTADQRSLELSQELYGITQAFIVD